MSVEETGSLELFEGKQQEITRQELVERVSEHVNRILRRNLYECITCSSSNTAPHGLPPSAGSPTETSASCV